MATTAARRALLRQVALFASLSDDELAAVPTTTRSLRRREVLFERGAPGANAYVVAGGRLKVTTTTPDGRELLLQIVGPGKVLGELALLDEKPRSATVSALEPASLLVIERRALLDLLRHAAVAAKLVAQLCGRIRQLSAALEETTYLDLPTRLARKLLPLAERYGRATSDGLLIDLKLTQKELAEMTGYSRESINKQLRAWSGARVLTMRQGFVTLHDLPALVSQAQLEL